MIRTEWNREYFVPECMRPSPRRYYMSDTKDAVLAAITDGATSVAEIWPLVGRGETTVLAALHKLEKEGKVTRKGIKCTRGTSYRWRLA